MLVIKNGCFDINSNDDGISSRGNLLIVDGIINITSGDDGIHAEYLTKILGGNINISKSYEGIEGACVEIYDGNIDIISIDDGINAANVDVLNYEYNIYIGGGMITIDASGDGIDSNGTIEIDGGTTIVYGPTSRNDGSLDSEKGILVNGGILIALGSNGMIESPASNSLQASIIYNENKTFYNNQEVMIKNSDNDVLFKLNAKKNFQSIVISMPKFTIGSIITIEVGNSSNSITIKDILNKIGNMIGPSGMNDKPIRP